MMRCVAGLDIRLPRAVEAMMRQGDRVAARVALSVAGEMGAPIAAGILRLWCLRQAQLEARAVARALDAELVEARQLPLFPDQALSSVKGCG